MQIFSPVADFQEIANCLDNKRLNKQKIEIFQILNCISLGENARGWKNHPAVKMARGYEQFFIEYALIIANKCLANGWKDTMIPRILNLKGKFSNQYIIPPYWGDEKFHLSHKSNLIKKLPSHYSKFWPDVPNDLPYYWPI